jgi:hypothetical protein
MKVIVDKSVWNKLKKGFVAAQKQDVKVGWINSSYGSDNDNLHHAQVAQWIEEGVASQNIPPRPFMRVGLPDAFARGKSEEAFKQLVISVANGKQTLTPLKAVGASVANTLEGVMEGWTTPMNAPLTIELKGFNDPLVETHELIDNITYMAGAD